MEAPTKTVFIGNLAWITTSEDLFQLFFRDGHGQLAYAEVQRYEDTHRSKGWGLAEFISHEAAQRAVQSLDGSELNGRQVHLRLDRNTTDNPNDGTIRVYVGNLAWVIGEGDIMQLFAPFRAISCNLVTNMYGRSRGFSIVKFLLEEDAMQAIEAMNGFVIADRPLECRFDRGNIRAVEETEARSTIYVGKLGLTINEDSHLIALFRHIGPIISARIQRAPNGRSKGWGVVKFENFADAKAAIESMNGIKLIGVPQQLEVRFDRK